jgi:hypothetical protein
VTPESAATESQQPQRAQERISQPPRTTADALVELFSSFANSWIRPLKEPLPKKRRRLFAFTGSLPWFFFNLKLDWFSEIEVFSGSGIGVSALISITVVTQIVLAAWFAFLIGYQERRCSPTRLFLEGLIFPGIAASLISGSVFTILFGLGGQQ